MSIPLIPRALLNLINARLDDVLMFNFHMDGYIAEAISPGGSASDILSSYFGKRVVLLYNGPQPRECPPATDFPQLKATTAFADGYPLLFMSEESVEAVQKEVRGYVGKQGVEERWAKDKLVIERCVPLCPRTEKNVEGPKVPSEYYLSRGWRIRRG